MKKIIGLRGTVDKILDKLNSIKGNNVTVEFEEYYLEWIDTPIFPEFRIYSEDGIIILYAESVSGKGNKRILEVNNLIIFSYNENSEFKLKYVYERNLMSENFINYLRKNPPYKTNSLT